MNVSTKAASARDLALLMPERWGVEPGPRLLGEPDGASALLIDAKPGEVTSVPTEAHIVSFVIKGESGHLLWHDDRQVLHGTVPDRSVNIVPAGVAPRSLISSTIRLLHIYLPHDDLVRRAQRAGWSGGLGGLEVFDPQHVHDDVIDSVGSHLASALTSTGPLDRLLADSLAAALSARVIQKWSNVGAGLRRPPAGGLASWQLRRVVEYLEAHLTEDIPLASLADLVCLSPNHFCTAFRISVGEPPHRYLVRRRIVRARELLAAPRANITEVAMAVGFGSSAHFATAFRREVGVTPSRYRRDRLS